MRVSKAKIAAAQRKQIERLRHIFESGSSHLNYAALMEALHIAATANIPCPGWVADEIMAVLVSDMKHGDGVVGRWAAQHRAT